MIDGAVYSWRFGGANVVERIQSANLDGADYT